MSSLQQAMKEPGSKIPQAQWNEEKKNNIDPSFNYLWAAGT